MQPLPTSNLPDELDKVNNSFYFYQSVASLEAYKSNDEQFLILEFTPEKVALLQYYIKKTTGNRALNIVNARKQISVNIVVQILPEIRG